MEMITEDYVSFEVAKLLKNKGFDEYCWCWYEEDGHFRVANDDYGVQSNSWHIESGDEFNCSAPSLQRAMKWLREKGIIIMPKPKHFNAIRKCYAWSCSIWLKNKHIELQSEFHSYEEACETVMKNILLTFVFD